MNESSCRIGLGWCAYTTILVTTSWLKLGVCFAVLLLPHNGGRRAWTRARARALVLVLAPALVSGRRTIVENDEGERE